ncbi:molybdopterin-binding protein [Sulfitobacter sp. D35]|uniref:molybdopterin-binding protein n=1 Tax=Sulfitobacter sp. D35 TaxID=3083252 RepID=UPI00296F4D55|nr:gephyrin-like molybdotransferase Glp [Sulfitobacter sp. D35]MDW4499786.1 molybdopterin-binding protein [Sulfitobacter sp. D35]
MSAFDTVLVVDWSGGNDRGPTPVKDAIWACIARDGRTEEPVYLRNRQVAEDWIAALLDREIAAGRRTLAGFDFPFGYPKGFCRALTGSDDPLALWSWLEARVEDSPQANNRFDLAGEINRGFGGSGPFWFNGLQRDIDGLPKTKDGYRNSFPERRACETRAKGSFTCWQLGGSGAVGGQVLTGLPVLERLRRRFGARAWPFEPLDAHVALIEVWPSLILGKEPEGRIRDAWQVREITRALSALAPDTLAAMLDVEAPEEGWILGLGHEAALDAARRAPPLLRNDCFALPPGVDWTPVSDALAMLRQKIAPVAAVAQATVSSAAGRIAAEDVTARRANPPHPNAAVDGYGFAGGRDEGHHEMQLVEGRAAAGDAPGAVPAGHAVRILTGAALPQGVDTVVLQEDVTVTDGRVAFRGPVRAGANTRKAGEDVQRGDVVLHQGRRIGAADAALLSACGVAEVSVHAPLRVAVLSTGDELCEAGSEAAPGQIHDANRPMLLELLRGFGHDPVDGGRVGDDRDRLRAALDAASETADAILTSGGASAGDEDHVSALLTETGSMALWRIAVKPGRPLALGLWRGKPVFGLPGNPVAAMVCTLIFARPALSVLAGGVWTEPQGFMVPAGFSKRKKPGRSEFLRARMRDGKAEVFASEGSGRISGLSWAEGLVELPMDGMEIAPGTPVRYIPFGSFGLRS